MVLGIVGLEDAIVLEEEERESDGGGGGAQSSNDKAKQGTTFRASPELWAKAVAKKERNRGQAYVSYANLSLFKVITLDLG